MDSDAHALWCRHCGSRNHLSLDCTKRHLIYAPTQADLEYAASQSSPAVAATEEAAAELQPERAPETTFQAGTFRGCPHICSMEWLPAFETEKECRGFQARNGPSCKVHKVWRCEACGRWHMRTDAPSPAGGSSGTTRENTKLPARLFRRKLRESAFAQDGQAELPRREMPAEPPKKVAPAAKKPLKSKGGRSELELF